MMNEMLSEIEKSEKPVVKVLFKYDTSKVIAIAFKKGMILKEHKTNVPTKLIVLKGHVVYEEEKRTFSLETLDEMMIPIGVLHLVEAFEDSVCLLIQG